MEYKFCGILLKEVETTMEKYLNNAMNSLDLTMSQARILDV